MKTKKNYVYDQTNTDTIKNNFSDKFTKIITQPLGTKKQATSLEKKYHPTSRDKKIMQPLTTKKVMQRLGTKKLCIIYEQKNYATSHDKINDAISRAKKITQPLGTKKSRNLSDIIISNYLIL